MKFRIYGMVLSLFFALGLVFSFGVEASASHGDGTGKVAKEVNPTSEEDVKAFLAHINDYYNQVFTRNTSDDDALTRELIIYGRDIRREGDYKNSEKNLYSMGINARGFVTNHAGYPELLGYEFKPDASGSEVASVIKALIDGSTLTEPKCETYGDQNRVACAQKVESPQGNVTTIAGLHHAKDDTAFSSPNCSEFALTTTPKDVFDAPTDTNLEAYVKGVIDAAQKLTARITAEEVNKVSGGDLLTLTDPTKWPKIFAGVGQRLYDKVACFGSDDAKHENIYAFVMDANPAVSTVLFNGNNFDLNGGNLNLADKQLKGEQNIAKLFNNALGDDRSVGNSAYVSYHWDDPTTPDDNVPNWFEDGVVPGTSCKRSYIKVADLNGQVTTAVAEELGVSVDFAAPFFSDPGLQRPYIFGSGTYPGDDTCAVSSDDDGGCAIAGAGHTVRSTALNLLLAASVLFSVVFLRKRA